MRVYYTHKHISAKREDPLFELWRVASCSDTGSYHRGGSTAHCNESTATLLQQPLNPLSGVGGVVRQGNIEHREILVVSSLNQSIAIKVQDVRDVPASNTSVARMLQRHMQGIIALSVLYSEHWFTHREHFVDKIGWYPRRLGRNQHGLQDRCRYIIREPMVMWTQPARPAG